MGKMSPPIFKPGLGQKGEKRVFNKLYNSTPDNFIILHSLQLRKHIKQLQGEIDFIVLAPDYGIFIFEVKGGEWKVENGQWTSYLGSQKRLSKKTPFVQAEDNKFSVVNSINKKFPEMRNILTSWGVVLPHITIPKELFEMDGEEWRVWDSTLINNDIFEFIKILSLNESARLRKMGINTKLPSKEDIEKISEFLRPNFECPRLIKSDADYIDHKIEKYTRDQFEVLDSMKDNQKLVIKGGAGTGKTLLATEAIRRAVFDKKNVVYVCKNREITQEVEKTLMEEGYYKLYPNYPIIKTWDAFLEHQTLYDSNTLQMKKTSSIDEWYKNLPDTFTKRTEFFENRYIDLPTPSNSSSEKIDKESLLIYEFGFHPLGFKMGGDFIIGDDNLMDIQQKDYLGTISKEEKISLKNTLDRDCINGIHQNYIQLLFNPYYVYTNKENSIRTQMKEEDREKHKVLPFSEWIKEYEPTEINIFDDIKKELIKNKKSFLDSTVLDISDDSLFIFSVFSQKGFLIKKSTNLKDTYKKHLEFLNDFKEKYINLLKSNNYYGESSNDNERSFDSDIYGRAVFFSDKKRHKRMIFEKGSSPDVYRVTDDYEIYKYFHTLTDINVNKSHDLNRLSNYIWRYDMEEIAIRIQSEIDYYLAIEKKDFFSNSTNHDLYKLSLPGNKIDILIADECQDIVKLLPDEGIEKSNLYALSKSMKGGLMNGQWMLFLDPMQFTHFKQGIRGGIESYNAVNNLIKKLSPAYRTLITNCRNTKELSSAMFKICDVDEGAQSLNFDYQINKEIESGIAPRFHYYESNNEIPKILNNILKPLYKEGVEGRDIQILSNNLKIQPDVLKANQYFSIFDYENGVYKNPQIGSESNLKRRQDNIKIHFFEKGEDNTQIFERMSDDFTPNTSDVTSLVDSYSALSESLLFVNYLDKEQSDELIQKIKKLTINNYEPLWKFDEEKLNALEDQNIFKYFNIDNPKTISFHEKFYKKKKNGDRVVDEEQIDLMLDLNNWYKEFSSDKRLFLPHQILKRGKMLNPLYTSFGEIYRGGKIMDSWTYNYKEFNDRINLTTQKLTEDETRHIGENKSKYVAGRITKRNYGTYPNLKKHFIKFCEDHIDFESKTVRHSTVFKFRGMDRKYVTLVGVNKISDYAIQAMYLGMSRAKVKLDVIAHKSLATKIEQKLNEK